MGKLLVNNKAVSHRELAKKVAGSEGKRPTLETDIPDRLPGGAYGVYVRLTRSLGVKIIRGRNSPEDATKEYETLVEAWKRVPRLVPKPVGVVAIMWEGEQHYGVVMQHIDGKTLTKHYKENYSRINSKTYKLRELLSKKGIRHDDLHGNNAMVVKTGPITRDKVIDWDPRFVRFDEEKEG